MTHEYNARRTAAGGQASERAGRDGVDTDYGMAAPDNHPFAAGGMYTEFSDELAGAVQEEGTTASANLWVNELDEYQWMNEWSGRAETHSMFRRSYE